MAFPLPDKNPDRIYVNAIADLQAALNDNAYRKIVTLTPKMHTLLWDTTKSDAVNQKGILYPSGTILDFNGGWVKDGRGTNANLVGVLTNEHYGTGTRDKDITFIKAKIWGDQANSRGFGIYGENVDNVELIDPYVTDTYHGGVEFNTLNSATRGGGAWGAAHDVYSLNVRLKNAIGYLCGTDSYAIGALGATPSQNAFVDGLRSQFHNYRAGGTGLTLSLVNGLDVKHVVSDGDGATAGQDGVRLYGCVHGSLEDIITRFNAQYGLRISITGAVRCTDITAKKIVSIKNIDNNIHINQGDDIFLDEVDAHYSSIGDGMKIIGGSLIVHVKNGSFIGNGLAAANGYGIRGAATATSYTWHTYFFGNKTLASVDVTSETDATKI